MVSIVETIFETGLELIAKSAPDAVKHLLGNILAKKGTELYYKLTDQKTDREILVELDDRINSLGYGLGGMEAIAVIKQYTASFNASFQQNAEMYEEISGLNERLRSGALEHQLKLQLTDVLNDLLPHYGVKLDTIENLVRE